MRKTPQRRGVARLESNDASHHSPPLHSPNAEVLTNKNKDRPECKHSPVLFLSVRSRRLAQSIRIIRTQRGLNNSALAILLELLLVALILQFIRITPAKKAPVIISLSGVITGIVASGLALYHYTDIIASFIENCNMFFKIYTQYFQKAWQTSCFFESNLL